MRIWIELPLLVAGVAWAWWVRRRMQQGQLRWLIRAAAQSTSRARTLTVSSQLIAAVLAIVLLAAALWAEQVYRAFWIRIPLALLVISVYVPFATQLAPVRIQLGKLRRSPEQRMLELGARPPVAEAIGRAGRPFAFVGSLIFLASIAVLAWHHVR